MEMFSLQNCITNLTLEQHNLCRKLDLLRISDHSRIVMSRQSLKREIKIKLKRLSELNFMPMSNTADDEASRNLGFGYIAVGHLSLRNEQSGRADTAVEMMANTKANLPPFDPFSPNSTDSRYGTRLKFCLPMRHKRQPKHIRLS